MTPECRENDFAMLILTDPDVCVCALPDLQYQVTEMTEPIILFPMMYQVLCKHTGMTPTLGSFLLI